MSQPHQHHPSAPCLRLLDGSLAGRTVTLDTEPLTIGADPSNRLVLPDDGVSEFAAQIFWTEHGVCLRGLCEGVTADGQPAGEIWIAPGSRIQIGPVAMALELPQAPTPAAAMPQALPRTAAREAGATVARKRPLLAVLGVVVVAAGFAIFYFANAMDKSPAESPAAAVSPAATRDSATVVPAAGGTPSANQTGKPEEPPANFEKAGEPAAPPSAARVFHAGPGQLTSALALSDGTYLVGGETDNLDWLPAGTPVIEIPSTSGTDWVLPDAANTGRRGIILHLSPDAANVLAAAVFPPGKGGPIVSLKTDVPPGYRTGSIFLAGAPTPTTYWFARLDGNFLSAKPSKLLWGVDAGNVHKNEVSSLWDVGNDGRVVFFSAAKPDWGVVSRYRADGLGMDDVPGWFEHGMKQPDGSPARQLSLKPGNGALRSQTWEQFNVLTDDGNGRLRKGSMPHDIFYAVPKEAGDRQRGYTYYAHRNTTASSVAIAVDRRNNATFIGGNAQSILPPWNDIPNAPDFEPYVIAYTPEGAVRWWSRLYSETIGEGGPFVSSDAGASWQPFTAGMLLGPVDRAVAVGKNLYIIERTTGLKVSENGGPWREISGDFPSYPLASLATLDGKTIFVGSASGDISKSTDGGKSWASSQNGIPASNRKLSVLEALPARRVLAGLDGSGMFASNDDGAKWAPVAGQPQDKRFRQLIADPVAPGRFYLVSQGEAYRSDDAGENWVSLGLKGKNFTSIAVDPKSPDTLYVGSDHGAEGIRVSTDAGKTWKEEKVGNTRITSVACIPGPDATKVFATSLDRKIYVRTPDGKNDWTSLRQAAGLEGSPGNFSLVVADPLKPGSVLAFTAGAGITSSPDQYVDAIAIDYSKPADAGEIVVLARSHGNNVSNLWPGKPGASFMERQTGTKGNEHYHWIGRLMEADGKFVNATWFVGLDPFSANFGPPFEDPNLNGWPDAVRGNPNLKGANGRSLGVAPDGKVFILGTTRAALTTRNAFQQMTNPLEGDAPWHDFLRVHAPDLSTVTYATALTGAGWDPATGEAPVSTKLSAAAASPAGGAYLVVGQDLGTGGEVPTANVPDWGKPRPNGESILIGIFPESR